MITLKSCRCFSRLGLLLTGIIPLLVNAQVIINAQLPPGGMVQKELLWNLTLINNGVDLTNANIQLTLQDAVTGQVAMSANTGNIVLNKGARVLSNADIQPVIYNYSSTDFSNNFLPMGSYVACYRVYAIQGESEDPLGDECINFEIAPLSPPLLNTPEDTSTILTPYPFFTWMPPAPVDMFNNLSYDIIITEILDGQSPAEAIENNTPVYTGNNLTNPNQNYPSGFAALDTGKIYAWRVIAKNGLSYAAKSDVWTFKIGKQIEPSRQVENVNYLLLENDLKDTYIINGKTLHIKYMSFDIEHDGTIIFSDEGGNQIESIHKKIVQGDNYFDINLDNGFLVHKVYDVIITDLAGKSQVLKFNINIK